MKTGGIVMAKKKKKAVDPQEKLPNGMYKERTVQAVMQGGLLLVFLIGLAVFSYIVSMIPAGLFGVAITQGNTTTQSVYDVQNIVLALLGLAICAVGGMFLARKIGEADAMYAFRNGQERTLDKRYLLLSVALAFLVYFILSGVAGLSFFAGPIRYLGIFLSRSPRKINEGIKVPILLRMLAAVICLAVEIPLVIKGTFDGFRSGMEELEEEEKENARMEAERKAREEAEAAEKAAQEAERAARRANRDRQ